MGTTVSVQLAAQAHIRPSFSLPAAAVTVFRVKSEWLCTQDI